MSLPDARHATYRQISQWMVSLYGDSYEIREIDARWRALGSGLVQRQRRDDAPGARWRREKRS